MTLPNFSNMYEQYLGIKERMLSLAQSNNHYGGRKFAPNSFFYSKVSSLHDISEELVSVLKSSPPEPSLLSLDLSNRPILGPYRKKGEERTYVGQFWNGGWDGLVFYVDSDGEFFFGQAKNSKVHGIGFWWKKSDGTYFGQLKDGYKNGSGLSRWASGAVYDGDFKNDEMHGNGTCTWPKSGRYSGEWRHDQKHGHGLLKYENGDSYDGEWYQDKFHGKAVLIS